MPSYTYQEQEMLNICFITITYTVQFFILPAFLPQIHSTLRPCARRDICKTRCENSLNRLEASELCQSLFKVNFQGLLKKDSF